MLSTPGIETFVARHASQDDGVRFLVMPLKKNLAILNFTLLQYDFYIKFRAVACIKFNNSDVRIKGNQWTQETEILVGRF